VNTSYLIFCTSYFLFNWFFTVTGNYLILNNELTFQVTFLGINIFYFDRCLCKKVFCFISFIDDDMEISFLPPVRHLHYILPLCKRIPETHAFNKNICL
jgi:hypothetical protein